MKVFLCAVGLLLGLRFLLNHYGGGLFSPEVVARPLSSELKRLVLRSMQHWNRIENCGDENYKTAFACLGDAISRSSTRDVQAFLCSIEDGGVWWDYYTRTVGG